MNCMDIRLLRYFLTVAQEGSFSNAAKLLFLSQPTLSRHIHNLEEELGVTLFTRTNRNVILTQDGQHLRRRAQEIVELADKTCKEFICSDKEISGDVHIGGGETHIMRYIAQIAVALRREHPDIHFHLYSGNADDVLERLDKGLIDFGIVIEPANLLKYDFLRLPGCDTWGLLMRQDHPFAQKEAITSDDLNGIPLLVSRQSQVSRDISGWLAHSIDSLQVVGTYNLLFNAAVMVEQGLCCALALDHLVQKMEVDSLCFRPLTPPLQVHLDLVYKKQQVFSSAAEAFFQKIKSDCSQAVPVLQ